MNFIPELRVPLHCELMIAHVALYRPLHIVCFIYAMSLALGVHFLSSPFMLRMRVFYISIIVIRFIHINPCRKTVDCLFPDISLGIVKHGLHAPGHRTLIWQQSAILDLAREYPQALKGITAYFLSLGLDVTSGRHFGGE